MFETFYNQAIRKLTVSFGSLFNNIYVQRLDANGDETERIRVPLGYGPKEKWIRKLRESNSLKEDGTETQIVLPRLSFEMSSISYDGSRKKNTMQKRIASHTTDGSKTFNSFAEVPYNFQFNVSAMVKFMEDGLCIMEQILPFFTPEFTISINYSTLNQKIDIPVVLSSVDINEEYEGDFDSRRMITFDMAFDAKGYIFGPTKTSGVINKVVSTIWEPSDGFYFGGITNSSPGLSGSTAAMSRIDVGVTGPSGSSSRVGDFTGYTVKKRIRGYTGDNGLNIDGSTLA